MKTSNLLKCLVFSANVLSGPVENEQKHNYFKLDFDIHRGNHVSDMGKGKKAELVKRDSFEMTLENAQTFYLTELEIGSNKNKVEVLVDTGSSDLWVMSHNVNCHTVSSSSKKRSINVGDMLILPHVDVSGDAGSNSVKNLTATKSTNIHEEHQIQGKDFGDDILSFIGINTDTPSSGGSGSGSGSGSSDSDSSGSGSGSNTCTTHGSFSTGESDTFNRNTSAPAFSIQYADGSSAKGIWGYDDVTIHNVTVNDLSFAVANDTSSDIGVLGIGLPGLEVTYSQGNINSYQYENLPIKMKNQGIIGKAAYSVYLGSSDDDTGTILFGAVDHAKYSGTLKTVPIVNTLEGSNYDQAIRLEVNVNTIHISEGSETASITDNGYAALLDTGSTLSYFPDSLLSSLGSSLGLSYSLSIGAYEISCNTGDAVKLSFNFSGANITVPLDDFVIRASTSTCILGILPQGGSDYMLLGDNFLRSAYVVFDLEDYTISLAQANYSDKEDIEEISSSIPDAEVISTAQTAAFTGGSESTDDSGSFDLEDNDDNAGYTVYPTLFMIFTSLAVLAAF